MFGRLEKSESISQDFSPPKGERLGQKALAVLTFTDQGSRAKGRLFSAVAL